MLLGKSLTSQALGPTKTPDLLKTEEAHQWKLSEEEEEERWETLQQAAIQDGFVKKGWRV